MRSQAVRQFRKVAPVFAMTLWMLWERQALAVSTSTDAFDDIPALWNNQTAAQRGCDSVIILDDTTYAYRPHHESFFEEHRIKIPSLFHTHQDTGDSVGAEQQYVKLQEMIQNLKEANEGLTKENRELVDRLVMDQESVRADVRVLNELVQTLKAELDLLRAREEKEAMHDNMSQETSHDYSSDHSKGNHAASGDETMEQESMTRTRTTMSDRIDVDSSSREVPESETKASIHDEDLITARTGIRPIGETIATGETLDTGREDEVNDHVSDDLTTNRTASEDQNISEVDSVSEGETIDISSEEADSYEEVGTVSEEERTSGDGVADVGDSIVEEEEAMSDMNASEPLTPPADVDVTDENVTLTIAVNGSAANDTIEEQTSDGSQVKKDEPVNDSAANHAVDEPTSDGSQVKKDEVSSSGSGHDEEVLIDFDELDVNKGDSASEASSSQDDSKQSSQPQNGDDSTSPPKKAGSLASFFEKVSERGNIMGDIAGARTIAGAGLSPQQGSSAKIKISDRDEEKPQGSGVDETGMGDNEQQQAEREHASVHMWGVPVKEEKAAPRVGLGVQPPHDQLDPQSVREVAAKKEQDVNHLTRGELLGAQGSDEGNPATPSQGEEETNQETKESLLSEDSTERGGGIDSESTQEDVTQASSTAPTSKSVNTDFVEGLDDIDKFMEAVDPPDELDVGAAGSSIQEVLMGQGTQILSKRVSMGVKHVRKNIAEFGDKTKQRLGRLVSRDRDKDGPFAIVAVGRERLGKVTRKLAKMYRRVLRRVENFLNPFGDGDEDMFGEEDAKIANLRQLVQERSGQRVAHASFPRSDNPSGRSVPRGEDVEQFIQQRLAQTRKS